MFPSEKSRGVRFGDLAGRSVDSSDRSVALNMSDPSTLVSVQNNMRLFSWKFNFYLISFSFSCATLIVLGFSAISNKSLSTSPVRFSIMKMGPKI